MLGRNLVSAAKTGTFAWDAGAPTEIITVIQALLELNDQRPGGMYCDFDIFFKINSLFFFFFKINANHPDY